ncbi:MAG: DegV family protein [Lachnospiraceae bacterium]
MSYEIFTDSTANLPNQIIERFKLNVIPVPVIVNGEITYSYEKDGKNDLKVFYDRLRKKESISTSCINEEAFAEAFEKTLEKGSDILYVAFSSALSVTCANGKAVAQRLAEKYPERKIFVVDSLGASMGEGLMVYHACTLKENGKSIEEVRDWLEKNKLRLAHWFTVEDLYWLFKGGRVKSTSYLLASMLNIKPVMHCDDEGRLTATGKVLGRKKSIAAMVDKMAETVENPEEQVVFIGHGDCIEDAEFLKNKISEKMKVKEFVTHYIDPVIGAHSGPGTLALFFLGKNR